MTDADILLRALAAYDAGAIDPGRPQRWPGSDPAGRLSRPDGTSWVLRAVRDDGPVPGHLSGCAAAGLRQWAQSRMMTLLRLEEAGYPTPRVILCAGSARKMRGGFAEDSRRMSNAGFGAPLTCPVRLADG